MMEVRQPTIKYTNYIPTHQLQRKKQILRTKVKESLEETLIQKLGT